MSKDKLYKLKLNLLDVGRGGGRQINENRKSRNRTNYV